MILEVCSNYQKYIKISFRLCYRKLYYDKDFDSVPIPSRFWINFFNSFIYDIMVNGQECCTRVRCILRGWISVDGLDVCVIVVVVIDMGEITMCDIVTELYYRSFFHPILVKNLIIEYPSFLRHTILGQFFKPSGFVFAYRRHGKSCI